MDQSITLDPELLLRLYRNMRRIRAFEETAWQMYAQQLMPGLAHLYIGEEAVAAGVCETLRPDDYLTSTHRGHGHVIAKGCPMRPMMAELLGRATGCCRGKGGSMHIASIEHGVIGANGIVGGGIPTAVGAALASKLQNSGRVTVCFFGDGASNNGTFHESLNMAALWKCPVVFVCENNLYGISVSQARHQAIRDIADRAAGYGMPGKVVDGNDAIAVYDAARKAVERARCKQGPTLLEMKTYRWGGHSVADPEHVYRDRDEVRDWKKRCPIVRLENHLRTHGILNDAKIAAIEEDVKKEIADAVQFAKASPFPDTSEAREDVFRMPPSEDRP
jgi:pyruvate dehydrogenase E1 component alpha subunit